jgi:hypothetical protein
MLQIDTYCTRRTYCTYIFLICLISKHLHTLQNVPRTIFRHNILAFFHQWEMYCTHICNNLCFFSTNTKTQIWSSYEKSKIGYFSPNIYIYIYIYILDFGFSFDRTSDLLADVRISKYILLICKLLQIQYIFLRKFVFINLTLYVGYT